MRPRVHSGHPRWQEAAKYFIQTLGAPGEIWNFGADDYARDINSRPFYANWIDASALVSVHNNAGEQTGTETWYDETNGQQDESRRLAEIVNRHVVSSIRARYNAGWVDRGLRSCDGCKGETRLASRPAVLVEIAYMDTPAPDNDALHDDAFKRIVAQALREAIQEWDQR
jgi:N-acetylmuramoyl-L-alanine amidase